MIRGGLAMGGADREGHDGRYGEDRFIRQPPSRKVKLASAPVAVRAALWQPRQVPCESIWAKVSTVVLVRNRGSSPCGKIGLLLAPRHCEETSM